MNAILPDIIFVPGIRPKPPADQQAFELRRCLRFALEQSAGGAVDVSKLAAQLEVIGWSWHFYGIHKDVESDRVGIEELLKGLADPSEVAKEAASFGRKLGSFLYGVADHFPTLSAAFATRSMETRTDEVRRYFRNRHDESDALRRMIIKRLKLSWSQNRPVILLAHSFGSVIAYDALWELTHLHNNPHKVDLFISMGSPLTLNFIRKRILGTGMVGAEQYPHNIIRWLNFAAQGEVTAQGRGMLDYFAEMQTLGLIESIQDNLGILNQYREPDGLNVHKCYGYLACPTIAAEIGAAIGEPSQ